jgi:phospholipid-binding lipoprotein MlaA
MRKICGIFIFSTLWFILPPYLSFCRSVENAFPGPGISSDEPTERFDRYDRGLDIDAGSDRFEYRRPTHPVKYAHRQTPTTNNDISERPIMAQATKSASEPSQPEDSEEDLTDPFEDEDDKDLPPLKTIADPIEPVNRAFFYFNDKLYFWLLKPVARGYRFILPQPVRIGVRNFFDNLGFPIRFVNCVLQGKFEGAGREANRFVVNTTAGLLGLIDVAEEKMDINEQDEDFGQTLGFYGLGPGFYINWPILGPSSLTDTVGIVGDIPLDPVSYTGETFIALPVRSLDLVNRTSLTIGEYEDLKRAALDPYVAMRDAYYQFRQNKIKE